MSVTTAEKYNTLIEKIPSVFEAGKAQGGGGDITKNPMYYATSINWSNTIFPEDFNLVWTVKNCPSNINGLLNRSKGVKTVKLICEESGIIDFNQLVRESEVEVLDLTNFKPVPKSINYLALSDPNLVSVLGEIDMSNCTVTTLAFSGATSLENISFKQGTIKIAISFVSSSLLSDTSIQSIIDGLADLTGSASQKVEFHSSIITNKLTDEQILQIASKNWTTE